MLGPPRFSSPGQAQDPWLATGTIPGQSGVTTQHPDVAESKIKRRVWIAEGSSGQRGPGASPSWNPLYLGGTWRDPRPPRITQLEGKGFRKETHRRQQYQPCAFPSERLVRATALPGLGVRLRAIWGECVCWGRGLTGRTQEVKGVSRDVRTLNGASWGRRENPPPVDRVWHQTPSERPSPGVLLEKPRSCRSAEAAQFPTPTAQLPVRGAVKAGESFTETGATQGRLAAGPVAAGPQGRSPRRWASKESGAATPGGHVTRWGCVRSNLQPFELIRGRRSSRWRVPGLCVRRPDGDPGREQVGTGSGSKTVPDPWSLLPCAGPSLGATHPSFSGSGFGGAETRRALSPSPAQVDAGPVFREALDGGRAHGLQSHVYF